MVEHINRRTFLRQVGLGAGALACADVLRGEATPGGVGAGGAAYDGPNVVVVRFGGGVRRRETIDAAHTYAPYFSKVLSKTGTLYPEMRIDQFVTTRDGREREIETSHGQGTLHILTGKYDSFINRNDQFIGEDFEPTVPTLFEYLRQAYGVPEHQTLIINNEDRTQEEFFTSSNHHMFGVQYRAQVLSLFRFKVHLLRSELAAGGLEQSKIALKQQELDKLEAVEQRLGREVTQSEQITGFWERWRAHWGDSGLVNPRGDRLLTELSVWAIRHLRPKLMMINYTDPDYVHWGNMQHYTRGVAIIDQGIRRLVETVEHDEAYRDNTVFVIVPDCGRDSNPLMAVPCQHHFNTNGAREIFAWVGGPGVQRGAVVDKPVEQVQVAATIGQLMGVKTPFAEPDVLGEALA